MSTKEEIIEAFAKFEPDSATIKEIRDLRKLLSNLTKERFGKKPEQPVE